MAERDAHGGEEQEAKFPDFETICAHWGEDRTKYFGAVIPPIYQNSLFTYPNTGARGTKWTGHEVYDYTRVSNPTTDITEAKIAALEGGEKARCFGSGAAAFSAAILSCVKSGDHAIAPRTVYGPTRQFLQDYLARFGVEVTLVDGCDPQEWANALRPNTTLLYLESPSSMIFKQQDIAAVAALAKAHGAATVCDNSWATPYFQNPLKMGVDLVLHSATKYLGGHSDVVAGVVVGKEERMRKMVAEEGCLLGAVLDPFASWLLLRGLRTLPIRMERHQQNARCIATALSEHPAIAAVHYPGLPSYPQAELTRRQLRGTSGLFSIELKKPGQEAVERFIDALHYFGIGCSWGGFESLAIPGAYPASMFGRPGNETCWFVRLHIGLESADDLWADIEHALETVAS